MQPPRGHMKPLGFHRDPEPVAELSIDDLPTPLEFWNDYVLPSKAVVFRGVAKKSPGSRLWTNEYLKEKYGDMVLRLEAKYEKETRMGHYPEGNLGIGRDSLDYFIDTYRTSNKYIVSELPTPMYHEVSVLPFLGCGAFKDQIVEVDLWVNGNNATSLLHKDAFNQLNCLYNGTKKWLLIDYKHEDKLYKAYAPKGKVSGVSLLNVSAIDLLRFPKFAEVPFQSTLLQPGDCLYLPGSMYHNVRSTGSKNLAVSLLFRRMQFKKNKSLDFGECANKHLDFQTLDKYQIDWPYNGKGEMSMGNAGFDVYRNVILKFYSKKGKLSLRRIYLVWKGFSDEQMVTEENAEKMYEKIVSLYGSENVPTEEMLANKTLMREIALMMEPLEPSNTYNLEYSVISAEDILKVLRVCLKRGNGKGSRELFTKLYTENLHGTKKYAKQFLDKVIGNDTEYFTIKEINANLRNTVEPYERRGNGTEPEEPKGYDVGDIARAKVRDYKERMKLINEEDDPSIFSDEDIFGDSDNDEDEGDEPEGDDDGEGNDEGNDEGDNEGNDEGDSDESDSEPLSESEISGEDTPEDTRDKAEANDDSTADVKEKKRDEL
eukprot:gene6811-7580_t